MRALTSPIVTTGVALLGAAVIVANPVDAPPADMAIRAEHSPAAVQRDLYLVDPAYLFAIAAAGPRPTEPVELVPRLVDTATGDGPAVSREMVATAYALGAATVSGPTQRWQSVPGMPAAVGPSTESFIGSGQGSQQAAILQETLALLFEDMTDTGTETLAAAFAAGAVDSVMPPLTEGDVAPPADELAAALYDGLAEAIVPLGPSPVVDDAVRTTIDSRVAELTSTTTAPPEVRNEPAPEPSPTPDPAEPGTVPAAGSPEVAPPASDEPTVEEDSTTEITARADGGPLDEAANANGATDLTDGNKFVPGGSATTARGGSRDALQEIQDRVTTAVQDFGDRLRSFAEQRKDTETGADDTPSSEDNDDASADGPSGG